MFCIFLLVSAFIVIATARTPEEWKDYFDSFEE